MSLSVTLAVLRTKDFCYQFRLDYISSELVDRLELVKKTLEHEIYLNEDEGLERTSTDYYGDPLTYVLAYEIIDILSNKVLINYKSSNIVLDIWDKAILAFISKLPLSTKIVLVWC
jgi:hypothetical protein